MSTDPFGTDELRRAALQAWRSSPTRFREDANAEEDLVLGGYRDRWFVELAQNAADAATRAGTPGRLRIRVHDGELRVANTGEPLDADGVAALASLRASAKRSGRSVGRFGIGFAAVLPVSGEPRVVSTSGGVAFSARRTREIVDAEPRLRDELAHRGGRVPVLRLVWPAGADERPPDGFDTEVRLPLEPGADPAALFAEAAEQAADLLLALPALHVIDIPGRCFRRHDLADSGAVVLEDNLSGRTRWRLVRRDGELPARLLTAADERHHPHWSVCWAVPVSDGVPEVPQPVGNGVPEVPQPVGNGVPEVPQPVGNDVLHAPTPTDERLSLPARLLVSLPMEPSRRRIRHGAAADHVLAEAVRAYPELVAAIAPEHRCALVPHAGFPRSDVDAVLRDGVVQALRAAQWLPAADGSVVSPARACVLDAPEPRLVELLAQLVPGLLAAPLSEPANAAAMVVLQVPRLGLADVVAAVSGVDRPPRWWHRLYDALAPALDVNPAAREDLAALPVPLADGRTVTGPRGTIVLDRALALPELRVVHPDAVHPLLVRLGAQPAGPHELLAGPALREAIERSVDDAEAGVDTGPLAEMVLGLVAAAGTNSRPELGGLALPDETGEPRRADELVLPDGTLRSVLAPDSPIGVLHPDLAGRFPRSVLHAVGVLDGFAVVVDENPIAPDHDLPDEARWWDGLAEPPQRLVAVRDLDLVDDDAWPTALRLLAAGPDTGQVLADTEPELRQADADAEPVRYDPATDARRALYDGYTRWWLARHARLAGHPPRHWRLASATALAGLFDPVPADLAIDDGVLAAAGVRTALSVADADDADDLVGRLADPDRHPTAAAVRAAHAALADAAADGIFAVDDLDLPATVRAVSGAVVDATSAYVLDRPWLAGIADPDRAVAGGDPEMLAELLDLPLASEVLSGRVVSSGFEVPWAELPEVSAVCEALGRQVPPGAVTLHETLTVSTPDGTEHAVPFWVDGGTVHAADPVRALVWHGAVSPPA